VLLFFYLNCLDLEGILLNSVKFELSVDANLVSLRIIQSFIVESANIFGFESSKAVNFELIAEEAFLYVLRFLDDCQKINIFTTYDEKYFYVSFFDKGAPFYKPEENDELKKANLMLIKTYCDKMLWINHGKDGKELKLLFKRPKKDIIQYDLPFQTEEKINPKSDSIVIDDFKESDAERISLLIYKTYGYTYPNPDMYYPEAVAQLNSAGKLISVVARDTDRCAVVGHYAIERYEEGCIAEFGQAAVEPSYRGFGILNRLRNRLEVNAKKLNLKGLYSQPVTTHTRTQKINESFNSKVCGISFGLVPEELDFRKMKLKPLNQRVTCFLYYKPFCKRARAVFIPKKHQNIIESIYSNLSIKTKAPKSIKIGKKGNVYARYMSNWGFGVINISKIGEDTKNQLRSAFSNLRLTTNADVVFLNLVLNDAPVDDLVNEAERLGFFFVGVLPYALNCRDIVRFEYLNTAIDVNKIQVFGDFAKNILDYSSKQMQEVLS
jgi:hypothetical protein